MNKATENQLFVSTLLVLTQPEYARSLNKAVLQLTKELDPVVGFGDCETDKPPRFGGEELS